ncbi:MAG: phytanoyl-CoA dioxygenase family protein [Acidimicrobiales bacterium]|nr:phytanoyl-CoA dioxygenase family protein [Acidimicrobiales bacterium]
MNERRRAFLADEHDAAIVEHGYVVVDDFLTADQVRELHHLLERSVPLDRDGLVFSNMIADPEVRGRVEDGIGAVVGPALLALLDDYRLAASLFVLKQPDDMSARIWHADPALVDERRYTSISAWCPLIDVDEDNGAFTVMEGSHRTVPVVRGGERIQGLLFPSEQETEALCEGDRVPIRLRAGQALLYEHRLAHGSPINRSGRRRWAVNVPAIPSEAPLIHYIRQADGDIDVYRLPDRYFYGHDAAIPMVEDPRAQRIATIERSTGEWIPA